MTDRLKLLCVLAHPDDETPGCAEISPNVVHHFFI
jgi:LmbE family N-acetylglucosaminyl deacetylase